MESLTCPFTVEELASSTKAQNELFDFIFRHLAAAGIGLASPQSQPGIPAADNTLQRAKTGPEKLLDLVDIFAALAAEERAAIAAKLQQHSYDKGETLADANNYAALPSDIVQKATAQLSKLKIPA